MTMTPARQSLEYASAFTSTPYLPIKHTYNPPVSRPPVLMSKPTPSYSPDGLEQVGEARLRLAVRHGCLAGCLADCRQRCERVCV